MSRLLAFFFLSGGIRLWRILRNLTWPMHLLYRELTTFRLRFQGLELKGLECSDDKTQRRGFMGLVTWIDTSNFEMNNLIMSPIPYKLR